MLFRSIVLATLVAFASAQGCSVCGDGKEVGNPEAIFAFPGQPAIPCGLLEVAGQSGNIPVEQCPFLPPLLGACECEPISSPTSPVAAPTDAPVTSTDAPVAPTSRPISLAPVSWSPVAGPVAFPVYSPAGSMEKGGSPVYSPIHFPVSLPVYAGDDDDGSPVASPVAVTGKKDGKKGGKKAMA